MKKAINLVAVFVVAVTAVTFYTYKTHNALPVVATANDGPHASLDAAITGFLVLLSSP